MPRQPGARNKVQLMSPLLLSFLSPFFVFASPSRFYYYQATSHTSNYSSIYPPSQPHWFHPSTLSPLCSFHDLVFLFILIFFLIFSFRKRQPTTVSVVTAHVAFISWTWSNPMKFIHQLEKSMEIKFHLVSCWCFVRRKIYSLLIVKLKFLSIRSRRI